jgi:hypothetical protein
MTIKMIVPLIAYSQKNAVPIGGQPGDHLDRHAALLGIDPLPRRIDRPQKPPRPPAKGPLSSGCPADVSHPRDRGALLTSLRRRGAPTPYLTSLGGHRTLPEGGGA